MMGDDVAQAMTADLMRHCVSFTRYQHGTILSWRFQQPGDSFTYMLTCWDGGWIAARHRAVFDGGRMGGLYETFDTPQKATAWLRRLMGNGPT